MAGFSVAIGAFVAGMAIATFPYNLEVVGKVRSLRDFFAIIFFVSLGLKIWAPDPLSLLAPSISLLAVVLVAKPLVMMFMTSVMGYGRRVSFLTGMSLFQVSEFSMIIAMQGLMAGNISAEVFSVIGIIAIVTITLTSYAIKYDNQLYRALSKELIVLERFSNTDKSMRQDIAEPEGRHTVIVGCHRLGYAIAKTLEKLGKEYIIVDFNPERVKTLIDEGMPCIYGDVGDIEVLDKLRLKKAEMVVSTVVDDEDSMLLISEAKASNKRTPVIVTAENVREALELYDYGADYVIVPRMLSGIVVSDLMEGHFARGHRLEAVKDKHIKELLKVEHEESVSKYEYSFVTSIEEKSQGDHETHQRRRGV